MWVALAVALTATMTACSDDDAPSLEEQTEIILKNRLTTNYWFSLQETRCEIIRVTDDKCYYSSVSNSSIKKLVGTYTVKNNVVTISYMSTVGPFEMTCTFSGMEMIATSQYGTTSFIQSDMNESKHFELDGTAYGLNKHFEKISGKSGNSYVLPAEMNPSQQDQYVTVEQFQDNLDYTLNMFFENISFEDGKMVLYHNSLGALYKTEVPYKVVREEGTGFWSGTQRHLLELQMQIGNSTKNVYGRLLKIDGQLIVNFDDNNARDLYSAIWLSFIKQDMKKDFSEKDIARYKESFDAAFDRSFISLVLSEKSSIADEKLRYDLAQYSWSCYDKKEKTILILHFDAARATAFLNSAKGMELYSGIYVLIDGQLLVRLSNAETGAKIVMYGEARIEGNNLHISGSEGERVFERTSFAELGDFEEYHYTYYRYFDKIQIATNKVAIDNRPELVVNDNYVIDVQELANKYLNELKALSCETWFEDGKMVFKANYAGETVEDAVPYSIGMTERGIPLLMLSDNMYGSRYERSYNVVRYHDNLFVTYMAGDIAEEMAELYLAYLYDETGYVPTIDDYKYLKNLISLAIPNSMITIMLQRNK